VNFVADAQDLGAGKLFPVNPSSIHAAHILDHDHIIIAENSAVFTANILLRKNDLVAHFLGNATDDDLVAFRGESPLRSLIVADDNTDHNSSPKC
jgi:hypothetical protein